MDHVELKPIGGNQGFFPPHIISAAFILLESKIMLDMFEKTILDTFKIFKNFNLLL